MQHVSLEQYRQPLTRVAVLRTLRELSHVYLDLGLDRVCNLLPIMPIHDILVLVADSRKAGYIKVHGGVSHALVEVETQFIIHG